MSEDYDLVVVGAGPAGTATALYAARAGMKVLVLERQPFPREKSCGDALSSQAIALIEELGLLPELLRGPFVPVSRVAFFSPTGQSVTVPLLKMDKSLPVTGMICRRVILDSMLLDAAREVAEVIDWCVVKEVLTDDQGRAVGVAAERGGGRPVRATAGAVVGADGARSIVARRMGVPPRPDRRSICARGYFRMALGTVGALEIHFIEDLLPGFVWIYPTESGMTNAGYTIPLADALRKRIKPLPALLAALASPLLRERFADAKLVGHPDISIEPTGHTMRRVHGEGFALVGDAAGLANPTSGEGIAQALLSGKLAARTLAMGQADAKSLNAYPQALWRELGAGLRMADRLIELRTPKAIDSLIKSAARRPHNAGWISGVLLGSALPSEELSSLLSYLDFFNR